MDSGWIEAVLHFGAFSVGLGFTTGFLGRRLKSAQATHFIHDSLGVQLRFQPLDRAVDRLSFANDDFGH